jgi:hypothetical protein
MTTELEMRDCPRFVKCNAPICPLDAQWSKRAMSDSDAVCFYLAESVKEGAEARFGRRGLDNLFLAMSVMVIPISSRHRRIERALQRAASSGSRMDVLPPRRDDHGEV